jgi:hypothetical protein
VIIEHDTECGMVASVPVEQRGGFKVDELWSFDRAVLTKVVEAYEPTGVDLLSGQILRHFPAAQYDDVRQSLRRLDKDGYIETTALRRGNGEVHFLRINGVTGKGLRASGAWPDDAELLADRILAALVERAENEPDPEKQSKVKTVLKAVGGMSRDVLVDVLGAAIKSTVAG